MRIVFMGTPDFAAASLQKLIEEKFEIVGVFTQPDKPKGRGMEMSVSPVKELALRHNLPVFQPEKMRDGTALAILRKLQPDILAVVAYGRILPDEMLELPKYGAVNVHGSLLPKYRGAAPIQWAVLNGDAVTGVSTMHLAHEMDTGDVIYTEETAIGEFETSGELFDRLKDMGAELLVKTLRDIAPKQQLVCLFGVATMELEGKSYRVFGAAYTGRHSGKAPGSLIAAGEEGLEFVCGNGETLLITELQAPGKKRMKAGDFLRGHKVQLT